MKLKPAAKPSKQAKTPAPEPEVESITEEQAESLEDRLTRLSGEIAEAQERLHNIALLTTQEINRRGRAFIDLIDRHMAESEQRIAYNVFEAINASPFWELKKVTESELNKTDAHAEFSRLISSGWRYIGYYRSNTNAIPADRYTLLIKSKGGPITEKEYLTFYEDFLRRRDEATKKKKASSESEPEVETVPEAASPVPVKKGVKLKIKGKK